MRSERTVWRWGIRLVGGAVVSEVAVSVGAMLVEGLGGRRALKIAPGFLCVQVYAKMKKIQSTG